MCANCGGVKRALDSDQCAKSLYRLHSAEYSHAYLALRQASCVSSGYVDVRCRTVRGTRNNDVEATVVVVFLTLL